jgi:hypothetical protein
MAGPARAAFASLFPLVAVLVGVALSVWRFRAGDSLGGLALGLGGMVLMLVLAIRSP